MAKSPNMGGWASLRGVATWPPGRLRRYAAQAAKYAVLIAFLVVFVYPFLVIWSSSLKDAKTELRVDPFTPPRVVHWGNLVEAWTTGHFDRYVGNTVLYCVTIVSAVCFLGCLAGYAFAMVPFPGKRVIFTIFLLGIMVPFHSLMVPLYFLTRDLHILNTYWGMIVPSTALSLPFAIFTMRSFFRGLPKELADAAKIDGCSEFGVFSRVMLPLAFPGLTSLATFQFLWTWNSFIIPLIFVLKDTLRPVATGMMFYTDRYGADRTMQAAGATIITVPIVVLYVIFHRQFIRGVTAGATKG